jgi:general secretion pathway protein H
MKDESAPSREKYPFSAGDGFTLIELAVVLFIISLTVAIVFPSFYNLGERRIDSEANRIASLLRYLNDSAIYTKETYSVKFDFKDDAISWDGPDGEKHEKIKSLSSLYLPSKGQINEGEASIFFGPLGAAESIEVHLKDKERGMTVSFSPVSGRAKISGG